MKTSYSALALCSAAASILLLSPSASAVVVSTISVDLHGDFQPDVLASTQLAGVVPADQWYGIPGLTGGFTGIVDTNGNGSMSIGWSAPTSGVIGGSSSNLGDEDMMEGYLSGQVDLSGASQPATIQFGNLNLATLGWDSYDLYVYSDQGITPPATVMLTYGPIPGSPVSYMHQEYSTGFGVGTSTFFDSQVGSLEGNYVVYSGQTAADFFLLSEPAGFSERSAINGFQIVGHASVPEPSLGLMAVIGGVFLAGRRKRKVVPK